MLLVPIYALLIAVSARDIVSRFKAHLDPSSLQKVAHLSDPATLDLTGSTIAPFLVTRVSGTPENTKVQDFIIKTFQHLNWHIEEDAFEDSTPFGKYIKGIYKKQGF